MRLRITGQHVYRAGILAMTFLIAGILLMSHTANADWGNPAQGYNYFNTGQYLGWNGYSAVIGGGLYAPTSIADFENEILNIYNSGTWAKWDPAEGDWGGYKTGAAFIIQAMRGGTDHSMPDASAIQDWKNDLANPNVVMKIRWYCNGGDGDEDTGYHQVSYTGSSDKGGVAWIIQPQCGDSIIFQNKSGSAIYFVVRMICGNPVGTDVGLPHYVPDNAPTGNIVAVTCDPTKEEYVVTATWGDADGSTKAELTRSSGSLPPTQAGSNESNPTAIGRTSATWRFKTTDILSGSWPIRLYVWDRQPAALGGGLTGPDLEDTANLPNCSPIVTLNTIGAAPNVSCTQVDLGMYDPNDPNSNIKYYWTVNGTRDPVNPNTITWTGGQGAGVKATLVTGLNGFSYWKANVIDVHVIDINDSADVVSKSVTLPMCGKVSCDTSTMPGQVVNGVRTPFTVSVKISGAPAGPPTGSFTNITMGSQVTSSSYSPAPPAPATVLTSTTQYYKANGSFTGSWTFGGPGLPNTVCPLNRTVTGVFEPYFTVLGGDVSAGQGFGDACTDDDTNADVEGYNVNDGTGNYFGASSRGAAMATGVLDQFATDVTNNVQSGSATNSVGGSTDGLTLATENIPPSGLAFANSATGGTTYGGQYLHNEPASFTWCVPDYMKGVTASGTFNQAAPTSGTFNLSGNTIGDVTIPHGVQVTVVATGNVYIDGNIKYQGYGGSTTDIPQFRLLVKGNIYINAAASQELHGFYAAEPNGANTGIIYTCATGAGAPSVDFNGCDYPLTVYGSVAAHEIVPGRTYGNVAPSSDPGSDKPAEQFVYTPEMWLSGTSGPTTSCAADPTQTSCLYQSYTSLPPVL